MENCVNQGCDMYSPACEFNCGMSNYGMRGCMAYETLKGNKEPVAKLQIQRGVSCRECVKAQVLLRLAMEAARGRLIDWTNKQHDGLFDEIEKYLEEHEPKTSGN